MKVALEIEQNKEIPERLQCSWKILYVFMEFFASFSHIFFYFLCFLSYLFSLSLYYLKSQFFFLLEILISSGHNFSEFFSHSYNFSLFHFSNSTWVFQTVAVRPNSSSHSSIGQLTEREKQLSKWKIVLRSKTR